MNQTVWKVVVPNYEDKVPISMRRRAKYSKKDDPELDNNLPKYNIGLKTNIPGIRKDF